MKLSRDQRRKSKFSPTQNELKNRIVEVVEFNDQLKFKPLDNIEEFLKINKELEQTGRTSKLFLSSWLNFFVVQLKERIANKAVEVAGEKMKAVQE